MEVLSSAVSAANNFSSSLRDLLCFASLARRIPVALANSSTSPSFDKKDEQVSRMQYPLPSLVGLWN